VGKSRHKVEQGQRFGRWLALESVVSTRHARCHMKCDCGALRYVSVPSLFRLLMPSESCGCASAERTAINTRRKASRGRISGLSMRLWDDDREDGL
jgi:hypothetical protein